MSPNNPPAPSIRIRPRIYIGKNIALGPGKIDLLEKVDQMRSISAAVWALDMPCNKTWLLVDSLNQGFGRSVEGLRRKGGLAK